MTKHTPGPWAATTRNGSWDWIVYKAANPNEEICQTFHDGTDLNETGEANAALIAAAPELLEVVKAMAIFDGRNNNAHLKQMAKDALRKAEGTDQ